MSKTGSHEHSNLTDQAGMHYDLIKHASGENDQAWIEVIQHMENIYADLVKSQVELEEKNAELENAQNFIQSIISSISDILIVCDINGNIQRVNKALENVVNRTSDELTGKPLRILISEEYQTMISEFPEHIRSDSIVDCEIDLINKSNVSVPLAINCSARYDHENRLSGFVITGRPLGELRKAYTELSQAHEKLKTTQQQLTQSEKMASLGRLVAGVAHELNNPTSFLYANMHAMQSYQQKFKTYIDAIHDNITTSEREKLRKDLKIDHIMSDISPLLEGSLEGAERVSEIVQNLQKFSSPQEKMKHPFDLIQIIKRSTSWVLKSARIKPKIFTEYPEYLELNNNEGHVHQILINLIQNAIDVMENLQDPQLHISVRQKNKYTEICIQDNGPGISAHNLARIFDPFFTTKAVGRGTGLGLYISYGLATQQCNGDLRAHNHDEGGAEFILSLPLEDF